MENEVKNSEWLAENIKGVKEMLESKNQRVKEMLDSIENDEHCLLEKYSKQDERIFNITDKEISRRCHFFADYYSTLTGELSSHSKSMKNNEKSTFDPPFIPMNRLRMYDDVEVIGSDLFDITPTEGSETSPSSDSDSETYYVSLSERLCLVPSTEEIVKRETVNMGTGISETEEREYQMLFERVLDYKNRINVSNKKLILADEEITKLKCGLQNTEMVMVKLGSLEVELMLAKNRIRMLEDDIEKEKERSLTLQRKIVDIEGELELEKNKVRESQEDVNKYAVELSDRDTRIQKLTAKLHDASQNFATEKCLLDSTVSELSKSLYNQEMITKELEVQCQLLVDVNKKVEAERDEMEKNQEALKKIIWQRHIKRLKIDMSETYASVVTSNENLDRLNLKCDMLMADKDRVNAKIQTFEAEICSRDDQIHLLKKNLHELQNENKRLSAVSGNSNKLTDELKSHIDELENEVRMQIHMICDLAEGKREAIRQLCFSIDYFRCEYEKLRNAYVVRKGP